MDMNKCFFLRKEDKSPKWHFIDATDMVLGRLATKVTNILRGKNRADFTPNVDCGDYVVIINCEKVKLTGNKYENKIYRTYSGWMGGQKDKTVREVMQRDPARIIKHAVKGMLPKNKLSRQIFKKLKVYKGGEHPHKAQVNMN